MHSVRRESGFTLIEVLVALIIVALASTFLIVGYNQLVQRQAASRIEEVQAWLAAAADISVLQSTVLGVTRIEDQLRLMAYYRGEWFLLADHEPLDVDAETHISWPENSLEAEMTRSMNSEHPRPYIVMTPSGEIFPEGLIELRVGVQQARIDWRESQEFSLKWQEG